MISVLIVTNYKSESEGVYLALVSLLAVYCLQEDNFGIGSNTTDVTRRFAIVWHDTQIVFDFQLIEFVCLYFTTLDMVSMVFIIILILQADSKC